MDDIRCPDCEAVNKTFWKFCINCGRELHTSVLDKASEPAHRFCAKCGASNEEGAANCIACGASMSLPIVPPQAAYAYNPSVISQRRVSEREPVILHADLPVESDTVSDIFTKAFQIYKSNFGVLFGAFWVVYLIMLAASVVVGMLGMFVPLLGNFVSFVISPLIIGIFYVNLRIVRGQFADIGQAFSILSEKYVPCLLAVLISSFILIIPAFVIVFLTMGSTIFKLFMLQPGAPPPDMEFLGNFIWGIAAATLLMMIAQMFFIFIYPLIADYETDFWKSITASAKYVWGNFWEVLLVAIVIFLVSLGGVLLFFIGAIFTGPLTITIITAYYEARKNRFVP